MRLSYSASHADPTTSYQRVICVVPMVGAGTLDDPKRPLFAPVSSLAAAEEAKPSKGFAEPAAIIAYHSVVTDSGNEAIVEFVARDRAAFAPLFEAKNHNLIQLFDRAHLKHEDVLQELRKVKKNFDFSMLRVGAF